MMLAEAAHETTDRARSPTFRMTRARPRGAPARRHAARLRQDHDAGTRRRQGNQARDDRRPDRARRGALRRARARTRAGARSSASSKARTPATTDAALATELQAIAADLEFLRHANIGQEKMAAADLERVRRIGERSLSRSRRRAAPDSHGGRAREPDDPVRNADERGARGHQPAHRVDDRDARVAAVAPAPRPRPRVRGRAPRAHGRHAATRAASRASRCRGRRG